MSDPGCPSPNELLAFSIGKLTEEDSVQVATHLETCVDCQTTIQGLDDSGDSLAAQFKGNPPEDRTVSQAELNDVIALVEAVGREPTLTAGRAAVAAKTDADLGYIRDYQLLAKVGQGGMGAVYKALHTKLDKVVALKVLPAERMRQPGAVKRFKREMKAVGKLNHPNIVAALDAGEVDGTHFLVMELVEGLDLSRLVYQEGTLGVADACEIVRQAAVGLHYAHEQGLVHRDIKPSNLMLVPRGTESGETTASISRMSDLVPSGIVKILDLGLARLYSENPDTSDLTGRGEVMGTLDYMAPEQADDTHSVDIRADIYSLGCTLFKLLTGHAPYSQQGRRQPLKKMMAHATAPIPSVIDQRPEVPAELQAVLEKMLAKVPEDRYDTPDQVALALESFAQGHELGALAGRCIDEQPTEPVEESVRTGTEDYLSSGMTGTDPDVKVQPVPITPGPSHAGVERNGTQVHRIFAVAAAVLLLGVAAYYTPQIIRIVTNKGVLVVKTDAPDIEVTIKKEGVIVADPTAKRRFVLAAGEDYEIEVKELPNGIHVFARQFSLTRGEKEIVNVQWEVADKPRKFRVKEAPSRKALSDNVIRRVDPHRKLAEWVLAQGGAVRVLVGEPYEEHVATESAQLPSGAFTVDTVDMHPIEVTNQQMEVLGALLKQVGNLSRLRLRGCGIRDEMLGELAGLPIHQLSLGQNPISDHGIKHIQSISGLRGLTLDLTQLSDAAMPLIATLAELNGLNLSNTPITDEGLSHLPALQKLTILSLIGTQITNEGLKHVARLKNLEVLQLQNTKVSDEGLRHLASLNRLRRLECADPNGNITGAFLKEFASHARLEYLSLTGSGITSRELAVLAELPALHRLDLQNCAVSDELAETLVQIHSLRELALLNVDISDVLLSRIKNLPLEELRLSVTQITDAGLEHISMMKTLRHLSLWEVPGITAAAVRRLQKALPDCRIGFRPAE